MRCTEVPRPITTYFQTHFGSWLAALPGRRPMMPPPASSQPYTTYVSKNRYLERHPDEKIEIPYKAGATFLATSHVPSPTTKPAFDTPNAQVRERIRTRHLAELCLEYLPDPGTLGEQQLCLSVTELIRGGEFRNSQIVTARAMPVVDGQPLPFSNLLPNDDRDGAAAVAAKFYDPMYSDYVQFDAWNLADCFYRNEALAYERLRPLQGIVVPRFYGSYTTDIPVPQAVVRHQHARPRPVRLILYEYVPGTVLASDEALEYSTTQRQAIMQAVLNAFSKMCQLGVYHDDFRPANIVVLSAEEGQEADIRCIDFGCSDLSDLDKETPTLEPESRESVVEYWLDEELNNQMYDFAFFIDWPWNEWLRNEYVGPKAGARL